MAPEHLDDDSPSPSSGPGDATRPGRGESGEPREEARRHGSKEPPTGAQRDPAEPLLRLSGAAPTPGAEADGVPAGSGPRERRPWWLLLVLVLVVGAADQGTKLWASRDLRQAHGGSLALYRGGSTTVAMTYVRNPGAAWGFLANTSASFRRPFFVVVSMLAMSFILYLFARLRGGQRFLAVALGLIHAGALGNFADRLQYGYVIDFIDLRFGSLRWPTFNVADVAIVFGVVMIFGEMAVATLRERARRKTSQT